MPRKKSSFTRIDELLTNQLKKLKLDEAFQIYPIWKQWMNLVGEPIASKTHPDYVQGTTLIVSVANSVWMNELELQKNKLLKKIASLGLDFQIKEIRFRMKETQRSGV